MGSDDLFKKRREARKKREHDIKKPKANSYLIVTEGKSTEPYYFRGISKLIQEKVGGAVDVVAIPQIEIHGGGVATMKLLEMAEERIKKANIIYQNIWIVFDKDDFEDFDLAVEEGKKRGYRIAWSNQSFEYWLFLHFEYSDADLHRKEWNEKLSEKFDQYQLGDRSYHKNYENLYQLVDTYGGVDTAIKNAKRRMSGFDEIHSKPSSYAPGTTVYKLVEELKEYLE